MGEKAPTTGASLSTPFLNEHVLFSQFFKCFSPVNLIHRYFHETFQLVIWDKPA